MQGFLPGYGDTGWLGISLAFGGTLMVLVWTIGPVSGCHVNPAVTLPMAVAGRLPWSRVPGYMIGQVGGAVAASLLLLALLKGIPSYSSAAHGLGANGNPREMAIWSLLLWEVVMTALFLAVIFSVTRKDAPTGFAGLAIGGFLLIAHLVGAQLGDSSLNPARSLGPAVVLRGGSLGILWVFIAGPFVGGLVGYALYRLLYED